MSSLTAGDGDCRGDLFRPRPDEPFACEGLEIPQCGRRDKGLDIFQAAREEHPSDSRCRDCLAVFSLYARNHGQRDRIFKLMRKAVVVECSYGVKCLFADGAMRDAERGRYPVAEKDGVKARLCLRRVGLFLQEIGGEMRARDDVGISRVIDDPREVGSSLHDQFDACFCRDG